MQGSVITVTAKSGTQTILKGLQVYLPLDTSRYTNSDLILTYDLVTFVKRLYFQNNECDSKIALQYGQVKPTGLVACPIYLQDERRDVSQMGSAFCKAGE